MKSGVVTEANERVPIASVLAMLGVELPDDFGLRNSHKSRCPFGEIYHSDHGVSPAMRVYPDSNSAYCFSCSAYYTPVSLAAKGFDLDWRSAAIKLLDHIGYQPLDLAAQWRAAVDYRPEPDRALLAEALKTFCRRIDPAWASRQFEPRIAATLTRCLALLELVHDASDVTLWLTRCKDAMQTALYMAQPSLREKSEVSWEGVSGSQKEPN